MRDEMIAQLQECKSVEDCIERLKKDCKLGSVELQSIPFKTLIDAGMEPGAIFCIVEYILLQQDMRFPAPYVKAMFDRFLRKNCLTVVQAVDSIEQDFEKERQRRSGGTNKIDEGKQAELAAKELYIRLEAGEDPLLMYINYNNEFVHLREQRKSYTERFVFLKHVTRMLAEHIAHSAIRKIGYTRDDKGRYIKE